MTKTPAPSGYESATHPPLDEFAGDAAPPLEGEEVCICGGLEGAHQVDGSCPSTGCEYFVALDAYDGPTLPDATTAADLVVEYDPGVSPLGRAG